MTSHFEGEDDPKRGGGSDHRDGGKGVDKTSRSGGQPGGELHTGAQVGRDELTQADYGGTDRNPAPDSELPHEGGLTEVSVESEGRTPTGERDRDYDPDGDRTGR